MQGQSDKEDFSDLSINERWSHSKWKARKSAYDEVCQQVLSSDLSFSNNVDELKSAASDSNVSALESGIKLVAEILKAMPLSQDNVRLANSIRKACLPSIAEKGLASIKTTIKASSMEAITQMCMLADPAGVIEDLVPLFKHKTPKVVAACALGTNLVFADFGNAVTNGYKALTDPSPVLKALPALFAHADKNVRAAALQLAVSIGRFSRPAVLQSLADIKPVQLNELNKELDKINSGDGWEPKLLTKKQQFLIEQQQQQQQGSGSGDGFGEGDSMQVEEDELEEEIDPWLNEQPQNILSSVPDNLSTALSDPKWLVRNEALTTIKDKLEKLKRLEPGNYGDLVGLLNQTISKDKNQACALSALQIVGLLANGLRPEFKPYSQASLEAIMERFKEKKPAFQTAIQTSLDSIFLHVLNGSFQGLLEPLLGSCIQHKTPTVRLESAKYLYHALCESPVAPTASDLKNIVPPIVKLLGDSMEANRSAAASVLAALIKIFGRERVTTVSGSLDGHKKNKVDELLESVQIKAKSVPSKKGAVASSAAQGANGAKRPIARSAAAQPRPPQSRPLQPGQQSQPGQAAKPSTLSGASGAARRPAPQLRSQPSQPVQSTQQSRLSHPQVPKEAPKTPTYTASNRQSATAHSPVRQNNDDSFRMDYMLDQIPPQETDLRRGSVPSFASTPKITKRSVRTAEFTPARQNDPKGRRFNSPASKPSQRPGQATSQVSNPAIVQSQGGISTGSNPSEMIAKYVQLYEREQARVRDFEARLATEQIEKNKVINHLEQQVSALKLQLRIKDEEYAQLRTKYNLAQETAQRNVGSRMNNLSISMESMSSPDLSTNSNSQQNLKARSQPSSRPNSQLPPSHMRTSLGYNRLVPLSTDQPAESAYSLAKNKRDNHEYERAISMTHNLKLRVQEYREMKQKGL